MTTKITRTVETKNWIGKLTLELEIKDIVGNHKLNNEQIESLMHNFLVASII